MKLNIDELKALISSQMKNENLHDSLPEDAIERIKEKILAKNSTDSAQGIPSVVSELDTVSLNTNTDDRKFPDERELVSSPEQQISMTGDTGPAVHVDAGEVPIDIPVEPTMGYTPEIPEPLKKAAPGELFVFDYNDVGESGENLSFKPMRLMDDPDAKKSMSDLWVQEGKTKAVVYVAKFEKMGEIEFNYADGTSKFTETASLPDYAGGTEYKDNPYAAESMPQIDAPTQDSLETYVKSSVDLEKVVHDIVMGILKDSILTNTEKAVNVVPASNVMEDIAASEDRQGYGVETTQRVKPMEESFDLTMDVLVESEEYKKITLPKELNERIKSGDKSLLVVENDDMQKWEFQDKTYYTPLNRLSKTKGYIKS